MLDEDEAQTELEAAPPTEYEVRLPLYEGPLDLLLRLIERRELEISKVSLALVADQFLEYVAALPEPEPRILASFLSMAARLLLIKSESLLPRPPAPEAGDDDEDAGAELVRRLREYKAVQDSARELRLRETEGLRSFVRPAPATPHPRKARKPPTTGLEGVTLGRLLSLAHRRMQLAMAFEAEPEIIAHEITVAEKVDELEARLRDAGPGQGLALGTVLAGARSRLEVVVTFMAVLELLRRNRATARQQSAYGEIWLRLPAPRPE